MLSSSEEWGQYFSGVSLEKNTTGQWFSIQGRFCLPGDIWQLELFGVATLGGGDAMASSRWRPGMLLNTLQCTGPLPTAENRPAQNANCAKVENPFREGSQYFNCPPSVFLFPCFLCVLVLCLSSVSLPLVKPPSPLLTICLLLLPLTTKSFFFLSFALSLFPVPRSFKVPGPWKMLLKLLFQLCH